ncbi:hypothetical protein LTR56_024816 [Elasticomyces elasticus]|nr:hypothetical protein LTR56_024816 [Elasticomyces elasticus]KAK3621797.1 hypothetical protein LTR22_025060 [Elasticomyces elasticus]KAK4906632.1 hypothetical protein LTR49_024245 [Elasticomyces elasticus]
MASSRQKPQHTCTLNNDDRFILYGDSVIQQSFSPHSTFAFGAALANVYAQEAQVKFLSHNVRYVDTLVPNSSRGLDQSVGVEKFQRNLRHMVCDRSVKARGDNVHIVLVTTPPIDGRKCLESDHKEEFAHLSKTLRRIAANTALHAQAIRDLGEETGIAVLDLHRSMLVLAGHDHLSGPLAGSIEAATNTTLRSLLVDGVPLSGEGYRPLFSEVMVLIERKWPEAMPSNLPLRLPTWDFHSARMTEMDEAGRGEIVKWGEGGNGRGGNRGGMGESDNMQGREELVVGKF